MEPGTGFSRWITWGNKANLKDLQLPGVYLIAKPKRNIENKPFGFLQEIIYIGMTNSKKGLSNRLKQFEDTIRGKRENHGGAQRVRKKYPNAFDLLENLYVAVRPFQCNVASNKVKDLLVMGKVAEYEYVCLARYVKRFKRLPEFNDKKRSPKN